jgi:hypothetical protein
LPDEGALKTDACNAWREANPTIHPVLSGVNLDGANLRRASAGLTSVMPLSMVPASAAPISVRQIPSQSTANHSERCEPEPGKPH